VAPVSAPMPNLKPSIPYPSRRDNERRRDQVNEQIDKFYEIFKEMSFKISFTDALILMPKFASTLKALIGNKEKISEMARTPMNEHCSAVIQNKLPRKLRDPGKFLIPCEFLGMDECLALSDLGASTNLMPLSVIAKDVLVKVGVFHFPADFVVVDFEPDPRVPLSLRRYFLKTGRALIDVHKGELTLQDDPNSPEFNPFYYDPEGDILLLEAILNSKPLPPLPNHEQYLPSYKKELKEKKTFTCPYGTFAYRHMPFSLCNATCTFQRGMLAIFHDMVKKTTKVFMDDFSVLGNSFKNCLSRLDKMLQRCEDTNLSLNWEKSHLMVKEGIVLGYKISKNRIEVDKAKVDVIAKLPHPTTVKENLAADHLSRLENPYENVLDPKEINKTFPLETLSRVTFRGDSSTPWFADFENYHAGNFIVKGENRASWSDKLDDALWAIRTAYKTPIGCTPYKIVYGKACHLPIELEHKAYWALKQANFDLTVASDHRKV
nr:reverse transcriptase domain-containing protein [Tanacetum cinerariifolium]